MPEFPTHFDTPEDAYYGFFRADSAKNAPGWAAVMSYPHVRVSATGNRAFYESAQEYADRADWAPREATGWVRSDGVTPRRLQQSDTKVHLCGGWIRFNAANEHILENRVTYILTKLDGSWGIQARFGVDSYAGHEIDETATAAESLVTEFVANLGNDDLAECAKLCRYPFTLVRIGNVITAENEQEMVDLLRGSTGRGVAAKKVSAAQTGTRGAVVELTTSYRDEPDENGIVLVGKTNDRWLIAGTSDIAY